MEPNPVQLTFQRAASLPVVKLSDPRAVRLAERRAFVEMKQTFMRAAADVSGPATAALQRQIRQSSQVADLRQLRGPLFAALPQQGAMAAIHRAEIQYHLDHLASAQDTETFDTLAPDSGLSSL